MKNFNWEGSILNKWGKNRFEEMLVEYNDIFARHRLDVGVNTEFELKLQPEYQKPVYSQSLPTPINLKEDLTVELALMENYGLITNLPYSRYSSPIFAQKKPNGKLRILVDLRKFNHLLRLDYDNDNYPIWTIRMIQLPTWLERVSWERLTSAKHIIVCKGLMQNQYSYLPLISHRGLSPTRGLLKD